MTAPIVQFRKEWREVAGKALGRSQAVLHRPKRDGPGLASIAHTCATTSLSNYVVDLTAPHEESNVNLGYVRNPP